MQDEQEIGNFANVEVFKNFMIEVTFLDCQSGRDGFS